MTEKAPDSFEGTDGSVFTSFQKLLIINAISVDVHGKSQNNDGGPCGRVFKNANL